MSNVAVFFGVREVSVLEPESKQPAIDHEIAELEKADQ